MGESFAGIYLSSPFIPMGKTAGLSDLAGSFGFHISPKEFLLIPKNLKSIIIGKGLLTNAAALTVVSVNAFLCEEKVILKIPQETFENFDHADHQSTVCFDRSTSSPWQDYYPRKSRVGNFKRDVSNCSSAAPTTPELISFSINALCYGGFATWSAYFKSKMDWRVEEAALAGCYISLKSLCSFTICKINYTYDSTPPMERVEAYFIRPSV